MKKKIIIAIRIISLIVIVYGIYLETGIFTAIAISLIVIAVELSLNTLNNTLDSVLRIAKAVESLSTRVGKTDKELKELKYFMKN